MRRTVLCRLIPLTLLPVAALAGQGGDWYGELQYSFGAQQFHDIKKEHCKDQLFRSDIRVVNIQFCGASGERVQSRARYNLKYTTDSDCQEELWTCKGADKQPHVMRPGNRRHLYHETNAQVGWTPLKDLTLGFRAREDGSTFDLGAKGTLTSRTSILGLEELTDVCTGETKVTPSHRDGQETWMMVFDLNGKIQDGVSRGEKVLGERTYSDGKQVEKVGWFIALPCDRVRDQFNKALVLAAKFGDPDFQDKAKTAEGLNKAIDAATGATTDAGVDTESCQLWDNKARHALTFEEFRRSLADGDYLCAPATVLDSIVEHERTHMKQCMAEKEKEFSNPTSQELGKAEHEAYCVEAGVLLDGLAKCGGAKPADKDRFQKTCDKR